MFFFIIWTLISSEGNQPLLGLSFTDRSGNTYVKGLSSCISGVIHLIRRRPGDVRGDSSWAGSWDR